MTEDNHVIVDLLARADALWANPRVYSNPATGLPGKVWAAVSERRKDYFTKGIEFPSTISGTAAWQEHSRHMRRLESAGLITICSSRQRRVGVRLTPMGDDLARHHAAMPMYCQVHPLLKRMAMLMENGACRPKSVREDDLAATDYGSPEASDKLIDLEFDIAPLKARGLVHDHADSQGRVWYYPTGETAPEPVEPDYLPEYTGEFFDLHLQLETQYLAERLDWKPRCNNLVVIPLSCGIGPKKSWHDLPADLQTKFLPTNDKAEPVAAMTTAEKEV